MSLIRPINLFGDGARKRWPDIVSLAIRFHAPPPFGAITPQAQDLLLHSVRSPWSLPLDLLRTDPTDILANSYHGFSKFDTGELESVHFRLRAKPTTVSGDNAIERLKEAVARQDANLLLEVHSDALSRYWQPLVEIHLLRPVDLADIELDIWPFRDGLGIQPRGFLQYLWPVPYLLNHAVGSILTDWNTPRMPPTFSSDLPSPPRAKVIQLVPRSGRRTAGRPQHPRGW